VLGSITDIRSFVAVSYCTVAISPYAIHSVEALPLSQTTSPGLCRTFLIRRPSLSPISRPKDPLGDVGTDKTGLTWVFPCVRKYLPTLTIGISM
jgi:hypothetical protein